ncbi:armadillo-type protein [Vararia minispora EC-137]|uniref:Armadillo-type protein n=1 Tax=Vararia minispora EC-137 TaxID=1314806 RepID=A0ACB8QX71_9AGAM|nr:armadillo-type protein [Vararia minispora EC-137]
MNSNVPQSTFPYASEYAIPPIYAAPPPMVAPSTTLAPPTTTTAFTVPPATAMNFGQPYVPPVVFAGSGPPPMIPAPPPAPRPSYLPLPPSPSPPRPPSASGQPHVPPAMFANPAPPPMVPAPPPTPRPSYVPLPPSPYPPHPSSASFYRPPPHDLSSRPRTTPTFASKTPIGVSLMLAGSSSRHRWLASLLFHPISATVANSEGNPSIGFLIRLLISEVQLKCGVSPDSSLDLGATRLRSGTRVRTLLWPNQVTLATYDIATFSEHFLHHAMAYLLTQINKPQERAIAFIATGHVATAVGSDMKPFLESIMAHIKTGLQKRGKKAPSEEPMFQCVGMLASAVGPNFTKLPHDQLDLMFACGLSDPLRQALVAIASHIPPLLKAIQDRLLDMLSLILSSHGYWPLARDGGVVGSRDAVASAAVAAAAGAQKQAREFAPNHSIEAISDVPDKLFTVGIADPDAWIRQTVLSSLHEQFDCHLAQAENVRSLFIALNDEAFENRVTAVGLIGRLALHKPAYVMPSPREALFQLLTELEYSTVQRVREDCAHLLTQLVSATHWQRPIKLYALPMLRVLLRKANDPNAAVAANELGALEFIMNESAKAPEFSAPAWDTSLVASREDWLEWMHRLSVEFMKESPSHALRACISLVDIHPPLARELFNAALISCWRELYEQYQPEEDLVRAIEYTITADATPSELVHRLLNLCEFMEHEDQRLPIENSTLGEYALKYHAYAKALHYKELKFFSESSPAIIEALININTRLQQHDAAWGTLSIAREQFSDQKHEELYERLGHTGGVRAQGMATAAAWSLNDWDQMDNYVASMRHDSPDRAFYRAILSVHQNQFSKVYTHITKARDLLDPEFTSLVGESYGRLYNTMPPCVRDVVTDPYATSPDREDAVIAPRGTRKRSVSPSTGRSKLQVGRDMYAYASRAVRTLVLSPDDDPKTWIKFANLCRKNERTQLAEKTINSLLSPERRAKADDHRDLAPLRALRRFFKQGQWQMELEDNWYARNVKDTLHSYLLATHYEPNWYKAWHTWALTNFYEHIYIRVYLQLPPAHVRQWALSSSAHSSSHPHSAAAWSVMSASVPSISSPRSALSASARRSVSAPKGPARLARTAEAVRQSALALGRFVSGAPHAACLVGIPKARRRLVAAKRRWTTPLVSEGKNPDITGESLISHIVPAVQGFFRSIALRSESSPQDTLRLLTFWFKYGTHDDASNATASVFGTVEVDTWLGVIPQSSSSSRKNAALAIMDRMKDHSHATVDQALLVGNEPIRVAILWHELWHERLEEAPRQYYTAHNPECMIAALEPPHDMLEAPPHARNGQHGMHRDGENVPDCFSWTSLATVSAISLARDLRGRIKAQGAPLASFDTMSGTQELAAIELGSNLCPQAGPGRRRGDRAQTVDVLGLTSKSRNIVRGYVTRQLDDRHGHRHLVHALVPVDRPVDLLVHSALLLTFAKTPGHLALCCRCILTLGVQPPPPSNMPTVTSSPLLGTAQLTPTIPPPPGNSLSPPTSPSDLL